MFTAKNYVKVNSVEEAFELNKTRNNVVMGGLMWLKQSHKNINTLIDLSSLKLNTIEENEDFIKIGAMVTLRELEKNDLLNKFFGNFFYDALKGIVGVQFRNGATIGGSVAGRFGFSDVITALSVLDSYVVYFDGEEKTMPLTKYVSLKKDSSILSHILIKKHAINTSYASVRTISTDFPTLAVAVSYTLGFDNQNDRLLSIAIGARPNVAKVIKFENFDTSELLTSYAQDVNNNSLKHMHDFVNTNIVYKLDDLTFGDNLKASRCYRVILAKTLIAKNLFELAQKGLI